MKIVAYFFCTSRVGKIIAKRQQDKAHILRKAPLGCGPEIIY
jgi:hypothetical protein